MAEPEERLVAVESPHSQPAFEMLVKAVVVADVAVAVVIAAAVAEGLILEIEGQVLKWGPVVIVAVPEFEFEAAAESWLEAAAGLQ